MSKYQIIDTPWNTTDKLVEIKDQGINTIIRYYDVKNSRRYPEKRLEYAEAKAISDAGLEILVVFEANGTGHSYFSQKKGKRDAELAFNWAKGNVLQPAGSAIYFAVDYDASRDELESNIVPYFKEVLESFKQMSNGDSIYKIGVYGSGLVTNEIKNMGLADYRWIAMSTGYRGTQDALNSGEYELHQIKIADQKIGGIDVDFDQKNPNVSDIGAFKV